MVDPDLGIAVPEEQLARRLEQFQPFFGRGQGIGRDHLLPLGHPWHMGIAVKGDTVGVQRQQFLHAFGDARA